MNQSCIFCKIYRGEVKSTFLHKDDKCFVIRDINPKVPTHLLIIPTRHFTMLSDMKADDEGIVGHLFNVAQEIAKKEGVAESGYRLVINQGPNSGQDVAHLHLHVLGGRALKTMG